MPDAVPFVLGRRRAQFRYSGEQNLRGSIGGSDFQHAAKRLFRGGPFELAISREVFLTKVTGLDPFLFDFACRA